MYFKKYAIDREPVNWSYFWLLEEKILELVDNLIEHDCEEWLYYCCSISALICINDFLKQKILTHDQITFQFSPRVILYTLEKKDIFCFRKEHSPIAKFEKQFIRFWQPYYVVSKRVVHKCSFMRLTANVSLNQS